MGTHLPEELRKDLLVRWSEPHRRYHTVTHLQQVLVAIELLARDGVGFDREPVELAAWFHDAVYVIGRDDNEERSAELARSSLGSSPLQREVSRLVLTTKTHKVDEHDANAAVLCDADLSILGSPWQQYRDYADAVRQEYAAVPDDAFRAGRVWVLSSLLEGPLFATYAGRTRWDQQARHNLAEEIAMLSPESPSAGNPGPG